MDYTLEPNVTTEDYYPDVFASPCDGELVRKDKVLLAVFYCLLFVLGLLGNCLVLLVLVVGRKLRGVTDVYLLNLAVADLLFVCSFPFQTHYQLDQWVFGTALCKVVSGFYYVGFFSSMLFITVMSVDRYLAVVHAVHALRVRTARMGAALSLAVWLTAVTATSPLLVFYQVAAEDGALQCQPSFSQQTAKWKLFVHFEMNVLGLLLPLCALAFCYTRILLQLRASRSHSKTRAVRLVLLVVVASLLFWVPFNVVLFLTSLHSLRVLDGCALSRRLLYATHVTETVSFTHCCVNPVIYAFMGEKFKQHLQDIFRKGRGHLFLQGARQRPRDGWDRASSQHSSCSGSSDCIL